MSKAKTQQTQQTQIQYRVKRNSGMPTILRGTTFPTYEAARSAVRSYLNTKEQSRNLRENGFTIVAV